MQFRLKEETMRITVLSICLVLSATTLASAQARPKDEAGIRDNVAAYVAAVNARDERKIGAVFAPDADLVFFDGPRLVGPDTIAKTHSETLASWPPTRKFSLEVTNIRFLGPDLALIETIGRFTEGDMRSNRGTILVTRRDGHWQWTAVRVYQAERD
jgi:uncharacterized protein (TIGR02246 family)